MYSRHSALSLSVLKCPQNAAPLGVLASPELSPCLCGSPGARVLAGAKASSPSPTQTNRLGWPQESSSTCPTAGSRPRTAPGPQPLLDSGPGAVTHTKKPCASELGDRQQSPGHRTRTWQREGPGAKSQTSTFPADIPRKGQPIAPWLKYGCPVGCRQRAPPPKETDPSRRTRNGRTSRSAEVCFVAGRRGRAPNAQLLARPISPAVGRGGPSRLAHL